VKIEEALPPMKKDRKEGENLAKVKSNLYFCKHPGNISYMHLSLILRKEYRPKSPEARGKFFLYDNRVALFCSIP
jgi:hypothetical protein